MKKSFLAEYLLTPWAMLPEALDALLARFASVVEGEKPPQASIAGAGYHKVDRLAVIPVHGAIFPRDTEYTMYYGLTTNEGLQRAIGAAAEDGGVDKIVLDMDSPGGSVAGTMETGDLIFQTREKKPVIAVVGSMAASAAYWMAAQASEIVVTPSGMGVGSIGVWTAHTDVSKMMEQWGRKVTLISSGKFKVDGHPYAPLSDSARADLQMKTDANYEEFLAAVARGRGTTAEAVRAGYGEGRMVLPRDAVAQGMADRVGTMKQTLVQLLRGDVAGRPGRAFNTLREFEGFLRDAGGCSRTEAAKLAAAGYAPAPANEPPAATAEVIDEETAAALRAYTAAMTSTEAQ